MDTCTVVEKSSQGGAKCASCNELSIFRTCELDLLHVSIILHVNNLLKNMGAILRVLETSPPKGVSTYILECTFLVYLSDVPRIEV